MQQINNNSNKTHGNGPTIALGAVSLSMVVATGILFNVFSSSEQSAREAYEQYIGSSQVVVSEEQPADTDVDVDASQSENIVDMISNAFDTTTINQDKVATDNSIADAFFSQIFNWQNGDEYDVAREKVISTFGDDSDLADVFIENQRIEESGVNYVDVYGINMKLLSSKHYVTDINTNGTYSYLAVVTVCSSDSDQRTNTEYNMAVTYTVDANNNMVDCDVFFTSVTSTPSNLF